MDVFCSQCRTQRGTENLGGKLLCEACMAPYFSPTLPTLSGLSTQDAYRLCRRCNSQVSNSEVTCPHCYYTELGLVPEPSVPVVTQPQPQPQSSPLPSAPNNPCWTCACGYEYNLGKTCQKCTRQNPQIASPQYPVQNFEEQKLSQSSPGTRFWSCSNCQYGYNMETRCHQCGYGRDGQPPIYQEAPAVMQNAGNGSTPVQNGSYWACGICHYAYNLEANCLKCKSAGPESFQKRNSQVGLGASSTVYNQQPAAPTYPTQINYAVPQQAIIYPQPTQQAHVSPPSSPTPGLWICSVCSYQYNRDSENTCGRPTCRKPKPMPENQPQVIPWVCPNCSQENTQLAEICRKCKVKRGWDNYLEFKGLELNHDKSMWKCSKCNHFVSISEAKCCYCDYVSKEIEKGLQGKGCKTTIWGRIMSKFS